jgi:hypothetical protein
MKRDFVMGYVSHEGDHITVLPLMSPEKVNLLEDFVISDKDKDAYYDRWIHRCDDITFKSEYWEGIRPIPLDIEMNVYARPCYVRRLHNLIFVLDQQICQDKESGKQIIEWCLHKLECEGRIDMMRPVSYEFDKIATCFRWQEAPKHKFRTFDDFISTNLTSLRAMTLIDKQVYDDVIYQLLNTKLP